LALGHAPPKIIDQSPPELAITDFLTFYWHCS
jgi:hypothetical protein